MYAVTRRVELKPTDPGRVRRILNVDDVETSASTECEDVVVVDEHVVYTTGKLVVVARDDCYPVERIGNVNQYDAVAAI